MNESYTGGLYLIGTPIGNMGDITMRALETLKTVELIAAEDTRQTKKILNHYSIKTPLTSYHEHNKKEKGPKLINELLGGRKIGLVSDAGMPGISDPGSDLVAECINQGINVTVIPGAAAFLTGLVGSGLNTKGFLFCGFFPRGKKERERLLTRLSHEEHTIIFYESPHRIVDALEVIKEQWGDRKCCVARELTKLYEEYRRGTISEVIKVYKDKPAKGEITLILAGETQSEEGEVSWTALEEYVKKLIDSGVSHKDAVKQISQEYGVSKRVLYNRMIR